LENRLILMIVKRAIFLNKLNIPMPAFWHAERMSTTAATALSAMTTQISASECWLQSQMESSSSANFEKMEVDWDDETVTMRGAKGTRYDAELFAKANGGRIVNHASLDNFMMERDRGAYGGEFWAREFATKGLLIEKGKDLLCDETKVLVEANALKKAHEASERGIFGKTEFLLFDPETLILKADTYILENPKITVVANAMSPDGLGKVDPITRIAVRTTEAELEKLECLNRHYSQVSNRNVAWRMD